MSHESIAHHYARLIGLDRPWQVSRVEVSHAEQEGESGTSAPAPKPACSRPLCRLIAFEKTLAVQATLLDHPGTAKRLAVLGLLHTGAVHNALRHWLEQEGEAPPAYARLNEAAEPFLRALSGRKKTTRRRAWLDLLSLEVDPGERYARLKDLSDADIDGLLTLLTAIRIGQAACDTLDTDPESLFNRLAADLGTRMRDHWTPDAAFLDRRNREQLGEIARVSGAHLTCTKKGELVTALARHFAAAKTAAKPTERQKLANGWLPGVMAFPAIEPSADPDPETEDTPQSAAA